jgi:hypothetical protein
MIAASIRLLDLTIVGERLESKGWTKERVQKGIRGYREYLQKIKDASADSVLRPSGDVDEVWHNHILFTRKYAVDCHSMFERFLHHEPDPLIWEKQEDGSECGCCRSKWEIADVGELVGV